MNEYYKNYLEYDHKKDSLYSYSKYDENLFEYRDSDDMFYLPLEGFAKGNMQSNIYRPYKIKNPDVPKVSSEKERMLLEVQMYSFALQDLNLYLNTHPTDKRVMSLFTKYKVNYNKALEQYENKYGGLELTRVNSDNTYWQWNMCPWPWEVM